MKKNNLELLSQLALGIFGVALFIIGTIILITSFFIPLTIPTPLLIGLFAISIGLTSFLITRLYFIILQLINTLTDLFIAFNLKQTPNLPINTEIININENTSQEELEEIKKKIPGGEKLFDNLFKIIGKDLSSLSKKNLSEMTKEELQKEMNEAVSLNNFEKAAIIRDLLKNK